MDKARDRADVSNAQKRTLPMGSKKKVSGRTSDFPDAGQSGMEPSNATHHANRIKNDGINLGPGR